MVKEEMERLKKFCEINGFTFSYNEIGDGWLNISMPIKYPDFETFFTHVYFSPEQVKVYTLLEVTRKMKNNYILALGNNVWNTLKTPDEEVNNG